MLVRSAWTNLRRLHRSKKNYRNIIVIGQIIGSSQIYSFMYYRSERMGWLKHWIKIFCGRSTKNFTEKKLLSKISYRYRIGGANRCITLNRRRLAWTGSPAPALKLTLAGTPAQPSFAPLQEKKYPAQRLGGPRTR